MNGYKLGEFRFQKLAIALIACGMLAAMGSMARAESPASAGEKVGAKVTPVGVAPGFASAATEADRAELSAANRSTFARTAPRGNGSLILMENRVAHPPAAATQFVWPDLDARSRPLGW